MISENKQAILNNMAFDATANEVEVGGNLEVDGNLAVNGSVGENISQADFIEPIEGVEISTFTCLRLGKLIFLDFKLKNNTGASINAWTNIATIKEAYRPQTTHYHSCSSTNPVGVASLYVSTNFQYSTALANEQSLHINCFYKIA